MMVHDGSLAAIHSACSCFLLLDLEGERQTKSDGKPIKENEHDLAVGSVHTSLLLLLPPATSDIETDKVAAAVVHSVSPDCT